MQSKLIGLITVPASTKELDPMDGQLIERTHGTTRQSPQNESNEPKNGRDVPPKSVHHVTHKNVHHVMDKNVHYVVDKNGRHMPHKNANWLRKIWKVIHSSSHRVLTKR